MFRSPEFPRILEGRWTFVLALSAVSLCIFEILDWYELPFEPLSVSATTLPIFANLISMMLAAGYVGLFIAMFLENMSLPIPSELFLPLAGYFVFLGRMSFPIAVAVSSIAGLFGSLLTYFLALRFSPPLVYAVAGKLGISQKTLATWEVWLSGRYGSALIFTARFVPGIRSSISIPAGVLRMNPLRFSLMTLIGSFGWSMILVYLGYSAGPLWQSSETAITNAILHGLPYAIGLISGIYVTYFVIRNIMTSRQWSEP